MNLEFKLPGVKLAEVSARRREKDSAGTMAARKAPGSAAASAALSELHSAPVSATASGEAKALRSDAHSARESAKDSGRATATQRALKLAAA